MTRSLTGAADAHITGDVVRPAFLLELVLDSGAVKIWDGTGTLNWDSKNWLGIGAAGSIGPVTEASDLSDTVIRATLSHIPIDTLPDFVEEFTDNDPVGRAFTLYLALFKADNTIDDVVTLTAGFIDSASMSDGEAGAVSIDLVSEQARLRRTRVYRLSHQHQEDLFTGDLGLEFVTDLDEEIRWGAATPQKIAQGPSAGGSSRGSGSGLDRLTGGGLERF